MEVSRALTPDNKHALVLDRAEHSAFPDRVRSGDSERRNPNLHRAILALCTALWGAFLRDDSTAKAWLNGDSSRSVLEANDRWQSK